MRQPELVVHADWSVALWPFQGELGALLRPGQVVVGETYPAEVYGHLGLNFRAGGKRTQAGRAANAARLLAWAGESPVEMAPALVAQIRDGFGNDAGGDDRFDAVVGLLGMRNVVWGRRAAGTPKREVVRRVEGWILGQQGAGMGD